MLITMRDNQDVSHKLTYIPFVFHNILILFLIFPYKGEEARIDFKPKFTSTLRIHLYHEVVICPVILILTFPFWLGYCNNVLVDTLKRTRNSKLIAFFIPYQLKQQKVPKYQHNSTTWFHHININIQFQMQLIAICYAICQMKFTWVPMIFSQLYLTSINNKH